MCSNHLLPLAGLHSAIRNMYASHSVFQSKGALCMSVLCLCGWTVLIYMSVLQ